MAKRMGRRWPVNLEEAKRYRSLGLSYKIIGAKYGVTGQAIFDLLKRHGEKGDKWQAGV